MSVESRRSDYSRDGDCAYHWTGKTRRITQTTCKCCKVPHDIVEHEYVFMKDTEDGKGTSHMGWMTR